MDSMDDKLVSIAVKVTYEELLLRELFKCVCSEARSAIKSKNNTKQS